MAALDTYKSVGRDALLSRPEGHQSLGNICGLSRQQIYMFRVGAQRPGPGPREKMQTHLAITASAWDSIPIIPPRVIHGGPKRTISAPRADAPPSLEPEEEEESPESEPPPLVRSGTSEEQRLQALASIRALAAKLEHQLSNNKRIKDIAPLSNTLRNLYKQEQEVVASLEDTTTGWAHSIEFLNLIDKIYKAVEPFPGAVDAIKTALREDDHD